MSVAAAKQTELKAVGVEKKPSAVTSDPDELAGYKESTLGYIWRCGCLAARIRRGETGSCAPRVPIHCLLDLQYY